MIDVVQIQLRHDTIENWIAANPILSLGEFALVDEATTNDYFVSLKIGDGVKSWNDLPLLFISKKEYNLFVEKSSITESLGDSSSMIVSQQFFSSYIYKLYGIEVIPNLSRSLGYFNNGVIVNDRIWASSDYVPSDQVTIKNIQMRCIISFWDKDKKFISQVGSLTEVTNIPQLEYPENTAYFTLSYFITTEKEYKIEIIRNIVDLNGIRTAIDTKLDKNNIQVLSEDEYAALTMKEEGRIYFIYS